MVIYKYDPVIKEETSRKSNELFSFNINKSTSNVKIKTSSEASANNIVRPNISGCNYKYTNNMNRQGDCNYLRLI
jgi:hypothetical protein